MGSGPLALGELHHERRNARPDPSRRPGTLSCPDSDIESLDLATSDEQRLQNDVITTSASRRPGRLCGVHPHSARGRRRPRCALLAAIYTQRNKRSRCWIAIPANRRAHVEARGDQVRDFYASLPPPVVVGIEATGSMGWFLRLMEELGITCRVGHPAKIRAGRNAPAETRSTRRGVAPRASDGRSLSRRSGCRRPNSAICARCCCIVISGCGCGRA